jgi:hypothetical protein
MATRWHAHEDELLRGQYEAGAPLATIARQLNRSEDAVSARRSALRLSPRRSAPSWSPREDAMVRVAAEAGLPARVLAARLQRPVEQVRARRRKLGLSRPRARPYTAAEDAIVRAAWVAGADVEELARRLNRAPDALRIRAGQLGLHRPPARRRWRADEDAVVRDGYTDGFTCKQIAGLLVGRTPAAIAARARKLGLATYGRRWTRADELRLARMLSVGSVDDAAGSLGRTPEAVRRRAQHLGIGLRRPPNDLRSGRRWTPAEDERLRLHAALNPAVLASLLGRSDHAVVARLRRLGLRAGRYGSPHHPTRTQGGFTLGERALLERELSTRGGRALYILERRLERSAEDLRTLAGSKVGAGRSRDDGP